MSKQLVFLFPLVAMAVLCAMPAGALNLGRLHIDPQLVLEGLYDDNIFLREVDIASSWIGRVRPEILLSYDYGPTDFFLGYGTEFLFYSEPTRADSYAQNNRLSVSAEHSFHERTSISFADEMLIGTDVAEISEIGISEVQPAGFLPSQRNFRINTVGVGVLHALDRQWELSSEATYGYYWYGATTGPSPEPVQETNQANILMSLSYHWHPVNSVILSAGFDYAEFLEGGNAETFLVTLGDSWEIAEGLTIEAAGGFEYLLRTIPVQQGVDVMNEESNSPHPYGRVAALWVTDPFRFSLVLLNELMDSSGLGTTVEGRSASIEAGYSPIEDMSLRAFGLYLKQDAADNVEMVDAESIQAGAAFDYRIASWVSSTLQYSFIDQNAIGEARLESTSYMDNRFIMGFVLSLPEGPSEPQ